MNSTRKGNQKEVRTAALLEADGYLVGSRRHIGGAGDLVATKEKCSIRLIEVKCTKTRYSNFPPADRKAMIAEAKKYGAVAQLAWWGPGMSKPDIVPYFEWPTS